MIQFSQHCGLTQTRTRMSSVRTVLVIGLCLVFISKLMADSENDFEESEEDEEAERPPPTSATGRATKTASRRPLHESARTPQIDPKRLNCPLCDSSVYSYCSDKLLHDACCCLSPLDTDLPPQCSYADCSFLHANTCKEHRLITACCCNQRL